MEVCIKVSLYGGVLTWRCPLCTMYVHGQQKFQNSTDVLFIRGVIACCHTYYYRHSYAIAPTM